MAGMSYDELEAYACGIYSCEPGPDGKRILRAWPDPQAMESRRISTPKLWTGPYTSRFHERLTPTPSCSSDDDAAYETSPENAASDYEDCLPIPPKSELRNGGLGLPHNKHREVQIIDNVFHGDGEVDGVAANIDISLIDGSCPVLGSRRNAGLPPVPAKHPQRQMSEQKDPRARQDSSFTIPSFTSRRYSGNNNASSNETLVAGSGDGVARSSPKSVAPPECTERYPARLSLAAANPARDVSLPSLYSELPAEPFSEDDADDEADDGYTRRAYTSSIHTNGTKPFSSATRHYQLDQTSHKELATCRNPNDFVHQDRIEDQGMDLQQNKDSGKFKAARALQRGKQSLDDRHLMGLMNVHPAVRMEAFKRNLQVPREGATAPTPEEQEKRESADRFQALEDLVGRRAAAGKDVERYRGV